MLLHYGTMTLSDSICCMEKYFDPFLTQNRTGTGSYGRKQRNACPANIGKQLETEPKRLRFFFGTTYGPEGRGFESLTACQKASYQAVRGFLLSTEVNRRSVMRIIREKTAAVCVDYQERILP